MPVPHYARKEGSTTIFYVSSLVGICFQQLHGIARLKRELDGPGVKRSS